MRRPVRPEELKLWAAITATVHPAPGRKRPQVPDAPDDPAAATASPPPPTAPPPKSAPKRPLAASPGAIEPNRKKRIVKEREDLDARLDLHGMDQDQARARLHGFLLRAQAEGVRAVLVITGKGFLGDGVLRRRTPEWLAEPVVRHVVAGVSEAHRRHGGEGALYVALKRKG